MRVAAAGNGVRKFVGGEGVRGREEVPENGLSRGGTSHPRGVLAELLRRNSLRDLLLKLVLLLREEGGVGCESGGSKNIAMALGGGVGIVVERELHEVGFVEVVGVAEAVGGAKRDVEVLLDKLFKGGELFGGKGCRGRRSENSVAGWVAGVRRTTDPASFASSALQRSFATLPSPDAGYLTAGGAIRVLPSTRNRRERDRACLRRACASGFDRRSGWRQSGTPSQRAR